MIQRTASCFSMGNVHIHFNDSGYLFNEMPTPKKKKKRIHHGHVSGINTLRKVLTCLYFSRSSKPFNRCLFCKVPVLLCLLFNCLCCF